MSSPLPLLPYSGPPRALVARDLVKVHAGRRVLDGVDLTAAPGRVLAVVGENGSGKSTLLRLLAGQEPADGGTIERPDDVGLLGQDLHVPPGTTVGGFLDAALAPLHALVERLEEVGGRLATHGDRGPLVEEYAALLDQATARDAWDATRRATEAAARLGLADVRPDRPVASLSGGQRSRLALAALLVRRPTCLLLDEPTNHLDDEAVGYLEAALRELPGAVVVASHDRVFLEAVADAVLDLDAGHLGSDGRGGRLRGTTAGGYTALLDDRRDARRRWEDAFADQQEELARLRRTAGVTARRVAPGREPRDNDKFIHHAKGENVARTVRRRVRGAERRIEVLERAAVPKPPRPLSFEGVLAPEAGASVRVRDLVVPGRLEVPRLDVVPGERLLVTGVNGSGKSTLLAVLAGRLDRAHWRGEVGVRARRVGHLPQDTRFARPEATPLGVYGAAVAEGPALADLGLLHPRDLRRPVGTLSVGQQRRLALAVLVGSGADLVLLDEPTNHLSLALAEELEEALLRSPGTVVVASHDRWLRRRWSGPALPL